MYLTDNLQKEYTSLVMIIGLLSSIVDNVPLVAGAMGMYEVSEAGFYAVDGLFWEFLAYCWNWRFRINYWLCCWSCRNGNLKIDFIWYVKGLVFLAFIGYIAGAITYILMQ